MPDATTDFTMPSLGADMDHGTLVQWLVSPGDHVERGDIMAVVDTDKSTIEVEVFTSGVVEELLVDEGTELPVGAAMARIRTPMTATRSDRRTSTPPSEPTPGEFVSQPQQSRRHAAQVASPVLRRLASDTGVDLTALSGSGPGGRITRADVEAAAGSSRREESEEVRQSEGVRQVVASRRQVPTDRGRRRVSPRARRLAAELGVDITDVVGTGPAMSVSGDDILMSPEVRSRALGRQHDPQRRSMRSRVGALMAKSKREIPHYYLSLTVDMGPAMAWLGDHNASEPVSSRMVPAAMLATATARAAVAGSPVNGHMVDGSFQAAETVQLGMAVSLRGGGLVAPVIADAERLDVVAMMARLRDLVGRARSGRLSATQMGDPTITVTSLGDRGTDAVLGVIYPPQVAMVGFGSVAQRPWVVDGVVNPVWLVTVTLAADHRVSDGHDGAVFLGEIARLLANPDQLATAGPLAAGGSELDGKEGLHGA